MAFQRPGMSDFTGVFGANQGLQVNLNRDNANGNLGTLPLLLREHQRADAAGGAVGHAIRSRPTITDTVNVFDSNLQMPYTQSYTVGWQRKLGRDTAFESATSAAAIVRTGRRSTSTRSTSRERVRRRVPEGAGQPAGEHRGRPRHHLRLHRRAGHVAAADLPGVLQRRDPARRRATRRATPSTQLDQRDVPRLPRRA